MIDIDVLTVIGRHVEEHNLPGHLRRGQECSLGRLLGRVHSLGLVPLPILLADDSLQRRSLAREVVQVQLDSRSRLDGDQSDTGVVSGIAGFGDRGIVTVAGCVDDAKGLGVLVDDQSLLELRIVRRGQVGSGKGRFSVDGTVEGASIPAQLDFIDD